MSAQENREVQAQLLVQHAATLARMVAAAHEQGLPMDAAVKLVLGIMTPKSGPPIRWPETMGDA